MKGAWRWAPWALLVVSIALRIGACLDPPPLNTDEARYLIAAHHLRTTGIYADWRGPEVDIHPLQPLLISLLGIDPGSLERRGRLVALVCSILLLWPLVVLTRRLGGSVAAGIVLLLVGIHPWLVRAASPAQPESLYDLLTACGIIALLGEHGIVMSVGRWALSGALFGLAYLARPEGLLVGLLTGAVAFADGDRSRVRALSKFGVFTITLLLVSSPYLVFLRAATGGWTVTGKTAELFFIGQAVHESNGAPAEPAAYLALMDRWKGVLPFVLANPWVVCVRALHNALQIGGCVVPRALGPAGLIGLLGCAALLLRQGDLRRRLMVIAAPGFTLLLMLLTFRNDRVIGSILPFVFVPASLGLATMAGMPGLAIQRRRALATLALLGSALLWWLPAAYRGAMGHGTRSPDRPAVRLALRTAGTGSHVASNSPALSFQAGDPSMFGPPGRYHPLPRRNTCSALAAELTRRDATVALLEGERSSDAMLPDFGACPLRLVSTFDDQDENRRIALFTWKMPPE